MFLLYSKIKICQYYFIIIFYNFNLYLILAVIYYKICQYFFNFIKIKVKYFFYLKKF